MKEEECFYCRGEGKVRDFLVEVHHGEFISSKEAYGFSTYNSYKECPICHGWGTTLTAIGEERNYGDV